MRRVAKKKVLLRIDPDLHEVIRRMAEAEMRSVNGQIEFLLKKAVIEQRGE
ncbi:MAG: TA system antitoxin ParD family protein [Candidatus Poseidoniales archaeon]